MLSLSNCPQDSEDILTISEHPVYVNYCHNHNVVGLIAENTFFDFPHYNRIFWQSRSELISSEMIKRGNLLVVLGPMHYAEVEKMGFEVVNFGK